jgi:hypothetical protein
MSASFLNASHIVVAAMFLILAGACLPLRRVRQAALKVAALLLNVALISLVLGAGLMAAGVLDEPAAVATIIESVAQRLDCPPEAVRSVVLLMLTSTMVIVGLTVLSVLRFATYLGSLDALLTGLKRLWRR